MTSKNLIVFLGSDSYFATHNVETKALQQYQVKVSITTETSKFFDQISSFLNFNQIKAFVFSVYGKHFSSVAEDYAFRLKCREFAQKYGIFCYFGDSFYVDAIAAISNTKIAVKEGERILIIDSVAKWIPMANIMLQRENGYYKIISIGGSSYPAYSPSWKKDILGSHKPAAIIFMQNQKNPYDPNAVGKMKKLFKGENFKTFFPNELKFYLTSTTAEIVQHLMGEKIMEYDVKVSCIARIEVRVDETILIKTSCADVLPFEKSVVIECDSKKSVSLYASYESYGLVYSIPLEAIKEIKLSKFKTKKVTVTLKLDINAFYDLIVEPVEKECAKKVHLEDKESSTNVVVKANEPEKARIIFDKQNFCVSYFSNNEEKIIADSDGSTKIPIYISFTKKKPIVGKDARNSYIEKPEFVVFDLIKLCSISNADITNPNWQFNVSKENETIIVTMQTLDGERKSKVEFLLALILKNGNDRIKKEYVKKMKDIEIGFVGFVPNEMLKKNFIEAGKLLNVNIVFC